MEKLSHMIIEVVNTKNWQALRMGKEGHWLSHLMFADDLLLLEEAKECRVRKSIKRRHVSCFPRMSVDV